MRLSDVKGDRTLDVIADVIEPIANLAADKEVTEFLQKKQVPKGQDRKLFLLERIKRFVPALLRTHKADVIKILAAIEGVGQEQYTEELNLVKLTKDCIDLLTDDTFIELFISAQSEDSSGSALENTAAPVA